MPKRPIRCRQFPAPLALDALEPRRLMSTYYVSPGGSDANPGTGDNTAFATLQRAADTVNAGDTVIVRPGTYPAGFVLGWDREVSGTAAAPIRFLADPGATITGRNYKTADGINLETDVHHVLIQGFTINNTSGTITRAGIRVVSCDFVTARNNTANNNGTWGIFSGFANDFTVEGNTTSRSQREHGIYVSNSGDRPVIRNNTVFGNYAAGIHMNGDVYAGGGDGIITGALVEGNVVYDNGTLGGSAINCDGVQDSVIRNNLMYGNRASGISLFRYNGGGGSSRNVLVNNTIVQAVNARWAINVANGSTDNKVFNNVLYNSPRGAINVFPDSLSGFVSDYNAVVNRFTLDDGGSFISLSQWRTQTGQDQHSVLITDPALLFANVTANDYRLRTGSPLVDAGTSALAGAAAPSVDIAALSRPQGAAWDIGAYEFAAAPPPTGTITGFAFEDVTGNAVKDATDPALAGWTVFLDANRNGSLDLGEPVTVTDAAGSYTFANLPGGNYRVTEIAPTGWRPLRSTAASYELTVTAATTATQIFANVRPASVSGTVFSDQNGDGVQSAKTDPGLAGWTTYVDTNNNRIFDAGERSTTTSSTGAYALGDLDPGTYVVRVVQQPNFTLAAPKSGYHQVTLVSGQALSGRHFGEQPVATKGKPRGQQSLAVQSTAMSSPELSLRSNSAIFPYVRLVAVDTSVATFSIRPTDWKFLLHV